MKAAQNAKSSKIRADGSTVVWPCNGRQLHSNSAMFVFVAVVYYLEVEWRSRGPRIGLGRSLTTEFAPCAEGELPMR